MKRGAVSLKRASRLALLAALGLAAASGPRAAPASGRAFARGKHRGVCFAHDLTPGRGYGTEECRDSLRRLAHLGVDWISVTPFAFQRGSDETSLRWVRSGGGRGIGETDERVCAAVRQAHDLGIRVMIKPHIWLRPPDWPGSIEFHSEEAWAEWFRGYREFIGHYADLARSASADALAIGNELARTTAREHEWRAVIRAVRDRYDGPLTYGATVEEAASVPFWDALDFIGISAYYPLSSAPSPDRATLAAAWAPHVAGLAELARRTGRTVVFTEIGYRSATGGAWRHWEIGRAAPVDLAVQAAAYEAFFDAVWPQPWFGGAYFWKWFSGTSPGEARNEFEPKGKPAEEVLARRVGSSRVDLQACKLEYSIVSPK